MLVDTIAQVVDVLWIYLRKAIDNVKVISAQGESNVFGKYPILETKRLNRHCHGMKGKSFQPFVAVGENMDFMAKVSQSSGQVH